MKLSVAAVSHGSTEVSKSAETQPAFGAWAKPLRVQEVLMTPQSVVGGPQGIPRSISSASTAASPTTNSKASLQSLGGEEEVEKRDGEEPTAAAEEVQQQTKRLLRPWLRAGRSESTVDSGEQPSSESGRARARPWRKLADKEAGADVESALSATAPEFVPLLSAAAPEFVPRWRRALQVIGLDGYSDWSSDAGDVDEDPCAECVDAHGKLKEVEVCNDQLPEAIVDAQPATPRDIAEASTPQSAASQSECEREPSESSQESTEVQQSDAPLDAESILGDFFKSKKGKKSKGRKTEGDKLSEKLEDSAGKAAPELKPENEIVAECSGEEPASEPDPELPAVASMQPNDPHLLSFEEKRQLFEVEAADEVGLPSSGLEHKEKESLNVEGAQCVETPAPAGAFDAQQLLRWRHAARGLSDSSVKYGLVDASASQEPVEASETRIREISAVVAVVDTLPSESPSGWRERLSTSAPKALEVSQNSWAARQRARRAALKAGGEDTVDVLRAAKSILNKLTLEKFPQLYAQLVSCGIQKAEDLQILIDEVFEKATTQHHFIDMYADLCAQLNDHFTQNPVGDGSGKTKAFKKLLLNACQTSFEKNLVAPGGLDGLDAEEQLIANFQYKNRMIGNIRFIGALLVRKMLASKVMIAIVEELLHDPTSETLESLAALLTVVGPAFDTPEWTGHVALRAVFDQVATIVKKGSATPRVKCLLKDLLDLRKDGWQDRKPKKIEGPSLISKVAERAQAEETGKPIASSDGWEQVGRRSK